MNILKIIFFSLLACSFSILANGQDAGLGANDSTAAPRISVITCGPGLELYSGFGHSAFRVQDLDGSDIVYNYGTFNFDDPEFYSKFTRGKLLYYVNPERFENFMRIYQYEKRSVYEQVLNLTNAQAIEINNFLLNNIKEENKYYKYDFLYDNCSTRMRDMFDTLYGERIQWSIATKSDSLSFRNRTDYYLRNNHWTRFGINLLLSTPVDKKMSNKESMFLPDYLMAGLRNARLNGEPLVAQTIQILPQEINFDPTTNVPKIVFWLLFIFVAWSTFWGRPKNLLKTFDIVFFAILGLLGCFMLFMWFGTEHQSCAYNRNLMWALPTHLIFAFLIPREIKARHYYATGAFMILVIALLWDLFARQQYIPEIIPILLICLLRLNHYRSKSIKPLWQNVLERFIKRKFSIKLL